MPNLTQIAGSKPVTTTDPSGNSANTAKGKQVGTPADRQSSDKIDNTRATVALSGSSADVTVTTKAASDPEIAMKPTSEEIAASKAAMFNALRDLISAYRSESLTFDHVQAFADAAKGMGHDPEKAMVEAFDDFFNSKDIPSKDAGFFQRMMAFASGKMQVAIREILDTKAADIDRLNTLRAGILEQPIHSKSDIQAVTSALDAYADRNGRQTEVSMIATSIFKGRADETAAAHFYAVAEKGRFTEEVDFLVATAGYENKDAFDVTRRDIVLGLYESYPPGSSKRDDMNVGDGAWDALDALIDPETRGLVPDVEFTGWELKPLTTAVVHNSAHMGSVFAQSPAAKEYVQTGTWPELPASTRPEE